MTGGASNYSANPAHPAHHGNQRSTAWPEHVFKPDSSLKRCFFPFLELPQKLRDLIYTFALVRDTICIIANQESFLGCGHNTITSYSVKYERTLRNLVCSRSTWVTSFDHRDARLPFSYEYLPHADCNLSNLRLFYTKRQIYRESLSIFYSSNLFDSIIGMV